MAQHFLLSSKSKTLSLFDIASLSKDEAFRMLCQCRWGSHEIVTCPKCQCTDKHYFLSKEYRWTCKECKHRFSVTSKTIFSSCKLEYRKYLAVIFLFANAAKGISISQLSRDVKLGYKTTFVLVHKIRESLANHRNNDFLQGEIHIDGTHVHSALRPKNKKADRVDRRKPKYDNPNKRAVLVMRERYSEQEQAESPNLKGAKRTLTFPIKSESKSAVIPLVNRYVKAGSRIHTDENAAYDELLFNYDLKRVNHQQEYCSDEGIHNNLAESYNSRFKRMIIGQIHKLSNRYLFNYANEIAYREDMRKEDNGKIFNDILSKCLHTPTHRDWCGYWQGNHKQDEVLYI
ncbi:IS1595 family transposase [Bisgaard Taxon 10/6]|uniref:IS1595 family transposase n=1 Tax=Exercitatus varius TaxID=67857 RepID=UPI00294B16AE|nr:IS1595 family transposase [Exercitatus varius]MDG2955142.1 IS1595 family transposase [Exercitatus varius]